ncbi:hypothetical protein [Roseateles amylovorans]|uniref:Uncharacterized protein n=1 Tax=Roseateles amylovorans TaxID=2978473 RepID=A0ABY6B3C0_9BURK|nr:hypothetical protein [Roseateles amylovorans]UXH78726.1 hypothetical protein N4261_01940 [Roseateles amylovorans]
MASRAMATAIRTGLLVLTGAIGLLSATPSQACVLVFGQGRNYEPQWAERNRHWDEVNRSFNLAVREPLTEAGLPVVNLVLPVEATDVPANLRGLVAAVQRHGCTRVLETTMFADPVAGLLIARLRLYPVIGLLGPQVAGAQPRIGPVSYTEQRDFALEARVMERAEPGRLGRLMGQAAVRAALVVPASPGSGASAVAPLAPVAP